MATAAESPLPTASIRRRLRLTSAILICLAVCAATLVVSALVSGIRRREESETASQMLSHLMSSLWNYNETHGCLPDPVLRDDSGRPRASWRFLIWNYIDATHAVIPDQRRPWILPDKTEVDVGEMAKRPSPFTFLKSTAEGTTRIAAIAGPGSAFDEQHRCHFSKIDGDTVVLVEVADSKIRWTEPGDYDWDGKNSDGAVHGSLKIGSATGGVFHVAFQDGEVWGLSADTPLAELSRFFTVQGAMQYDRESILGRYRR